MTSAWVNSGNAVILVPVFAMSTANKLCFLNAGDGLHEDDTLLQMVHSINGTALPGVLYGETEIVDSQGHFLYMRRLSAPATLT